MLAHHCLLDQFTYTEKKKFKTKMNDQKAQISCASHKNDLPISSVSPLSIVVWFAIPNFTKSMSGSNPGETAYLNFCSHKDLFEINQLTLWSIYLEKLQAVPQKILLLLS